jgi:hypothetical protein
VSRVAHSQAMAISTPDRVAEADLWWRKATRSAENKLHDTSESSCAPWSKLRCIACFTMPDPRLPTGLVQPNRLPPKVRLAECWPWPPGPLCHSRMHLITPLQYSYGAPEPLTPPLDVHLEPHKYKTASLESCASTQYPCVV